MVRLEGMGAVHAGLFAGRDEQLERRVGEVRAVQDGQAVRYRDAVVRTECRAVRPHEIALDLEGYGVLGEVVAGPLGLLADHVHVPLDDHRGGILVSRGPGLLDDDVEGFVLKDFKLPLPGKADQVVAHLLFVS
jgi:hypothetical protein